MPVTTLLPAPKKFLIPYIFAHPKPDLVALGKKKREILLLVDNEGLPSAVRWDYQHPAFTKLCSITRSHAQWNGKFWVFQDGGESSDNELATLQRKSAGITAYQQLIRSGIVCADDFVTIGVYQEPNDNHSAESQLVAIEGFSDRIFSIRVQAGAPGAGALTSLIVDSSESYWLYQRGPTLMLQWIGDSDALCRLQSQSGFDAANWRIIKQAHHEPLKVDFSGWEVTVTTRCHKNPTHFLLIDEPHAPLREKPVRMTIADWAGYRRTLEKFGIGWTGNDPLEAPSSEDPRLSQLPGWCLPAPNGHMLRAYQREGIAFAMNRGARALFGDEMGVGKTVQALMTAIAAGAEKTLIVCPANVKEVWRSEICAWQDHCSANAVQVLANRGEKPRSSAKWLIANYEQLTTTKRQQDDTDDGPPIGWADFLIIDEAHRIKNPRAARTKAVAELASQALRGVILCTGTPVRNHEAEAVALISALDSTQAQRLKRLRYSMKAIASVLECVMIRRTKAQVLPELPEVQWQEIKIQVKPTYEYLAAHSAAISAYAEHIIAGASQAQATVAARPHLATARRLLGLIKSVTNEVIQHIKTVCDERGCVVVFAHHLEVHNTLKNRLDALSLRTEIIDGRANQKRASARLVKEFQAGDIDVLICGITSAGEGITLHRADTVVILEYPWVPGEMQQAASRHHRIGQMADKCHVIHLAAVFEDGKTQTLDHFMQSVLIRKISRVNAALGENHTIIGHDNEELARSIQSEVIDHMARLEPTST